MWIPHSAIRKGVTTLHWLTANWSIDKTETAVKLNVKLGSNSLETKFKFATNKKFSGFWIDMPFERSHEIILMNNKGYIILLLHPKKKSKLKHNNQGHDRKCIILRQGLYQRHKSLLVEFSIACTPKQQCLNRMLRTVKPFNLFILNSLRLDYDNVWKYGPMYMLTFHSVTTVIANLYIQISLII